MSNVIDARHAALLALMLAATACTREAPVPAPSPAVATEHDAQLAWAREALARNPDLEVLAVDPRGVFTVRMRQGGSLRTIQMDELIAAPPAGAAPAAPEEPESTAGTATFETAAAEPGSPAVAGAMPPGVTVTREAGNVSITGPGVSIATTGEPAAVAGASRSEAGAPSARAERRGNQPLVCQGARLMHIDSRVIEFDGDGLIVEDGCDLYLTNSRITAGGTAITVMRGKVHIVNSTVKGGRSSIDASHGAQVFMSGASIDGLQRRFDTARINDLGGNRYR